MAGVVENHGVAETWSIRGFKATGGGFRKDVSLRMQLCTTLD